MHFITTLSRGGAENQLLILCREQIRAGFEVTVVPLTGKPELVCDFYDAGVQVDLTLINQSFLKQLVTIRKLDLKSDIWHAHLPQAELLLATTNLAPIVVTRHFGGKFYPRAPKLLSSRLSRFATRNASGIVAVSEFVSNYLRDSHEISKKKQIKVIPYGFNSQEFIKSLEKPKKDSRSKINGPIIGTLARLSPEKDLQTLIKGFAVYSLKSEGNPHLHIYGDGPEGPKLRELVNSLQMSHRIQFKGRTLNPADALTTFDVFVLTSLFEGFGMVLLESMSVKLPIICSRIPTALEVLGEEGSASFFEPGNSIDLAEKLVDFEHEMSSEYIIKQKERLDNFSSLKMFNAISNFYRGVLNLPRIDPIHKYSVGMDRENYEGS